MYVALSLEFRDGKGNEGMNEGVKECMLDCSAYKLEHLSVFSHLDLLYKGVYGEASSWWNGL